MSTLDDLIDRKITVDISSKTATLPEGKAQATLVEYQGARQVVGKADGQLYEVLPAIFLIEGDQYNTLAGRESVRAKYDIWVAMTENNDIDTGKREDGTDKNAKMARFFKAFGRTTLDSSFGELIGGRATIGVKPEMDQNDEPRSVLKVTFVGAAR